MLRLSRVLTFVIQIIVYVGGISVYRLYFHPLAKYPGPFFARVSPVRFADHQGTSRQKLTLNPQIPCTLALLKGRIPFWIKAQHGKYGPIVRVSPNELCFDDAAAWKVREPLKRQ